MARAAANRTRAAPDGTAHVIEAMPQIGDGSEPEAIPIVLGVIEGRQYARAKSVEVRAQRREIGPGVADGQELR